MRLRDFSRYDSGERGVAGWDGRKGLYIKVEIGGELYVNTLNKMHQNMKTLV